MSRTKKGYTLIEVMIVLAVMGTLMLGAIKISQGQDRQTNFNQSAQDIKAKVQSYAEEVGNTASPFSSNYTCAVVANRPVLTANSASSTPGANSDCIFLGKAIQAIPGTASFYAYTVLGTRAQNGVSGALPASTYSEANPEPAFASGADLTDQYKTLGGAKIVSSKITYSSGGSPTDSSLVGFYNSFTASGSESNNQQLLVKGYSCDAVACPPKSATLKTCIEETANPCINTASISLWELCMSDSQGKQTAKLSVSSTSAGVTTTLSFVACT